MRRLLVCGVVAGCCARGTAGAAPAGAGLSGGGLLWASETMSPRAVDGEPTSSAVCPDGDAGLGAVASQLADGRIAPDDPIALRLALRAAGEPHVWPRALVLDSRGHVDPSEVRRRLTDWLGQIPHDGRLRCATASAVRGGRAIAAAVAVDALADLTPVPTIVRPSTWIDVEASVLVPATGARLVVFGPTGRPHTVPTSLDRGRLKARAYLDQPGEWSLQVVVDGESGPRPALEALVFAGVAPPSRAPEAGPPFGPASASDDPARELLDRIAAARRSFGLAPLTESAALDRAARAHAERMMRAGRLAHDVGDGDPSARAGALFGAREVGENVAHARTAELAHRAVWESPSHRLNLLAPRFTLVGTGVARDPDGTLWVTELFARSGGLSR